MASPSFKSSRACVAFLGRSYQMVVAFIYRDPMSDYTGWMGFNEKTVNSKGQLVLKSEWFDS